MDAEPAPPGLDAKAAADYGYGLYSARYANIYTSRQLLQLVRESRGEFRPADPVWERNGRFYDSMRPSVEPEGLCSPDAVLDHRAYHLTKVLEVVGTADLFIFTLGLTETWIDAQSGTIYPTAPGTIAGSYDSGVHRFHTLTCLEVYDDMRTFFDLVTDLNPNIRFLLTVSPVPLTATASGHHVLAATTYSKSVLRAAAGQLFQERDNVDYFPSYEIFVSSLSKGQYFHPNLRSIRPEGVRAAMNTFFAAHDGGSLAVEEPLPINPDNGRTAVPSDPDEEVVCEEVLLDALLQ